MDVSDIPTGENRFVIEVALAGDYIKLVFNRGHLVAHAGDFLLTWDELVDSIRQGLASRIGEHGAINVGGGQDRTVGYTGVIVVQPGDGAFWNRRLGRSISSHLVVGKKTLTRELCVWGEWHGPDTFTVFTCYPGTAAPKEIHDPTLDFDEIDQSIAFWSTRAIVVDDESVSQGREDR